MKKTTVYEVEAYDEIADETLASGIACLSDAGPVRGNFLNTLEKRGLRSLAMLRQQDPDFLRKYIADVETWLLDLKPTDEKVAAIQREYCDLSVTRKMQAIEMFLRGGGDAPVWSKGHPMSNRGLSGIEQERDPGVVYHQGSR